MVTTGCNKEICVDTELRLSLTAGEYAIKIRLGG